MANREEKSLYVPLPWKKDFWMTTNRKRHLESEFLTVSNFIDLIQFHLIYQLIWG